MLRGWAACAPAGLWPDQITCTWLELGSGAALQLDLLVFEA